MIFRYHTEAVRPSVLALAVGMLLLGWWWGGALGVALWGSALGMGCWALLQVLRRGCAIRLYDEYLLVQGSISGRARRIPYAQIGGFAITRRGGLALLYRETTDQPPQLASHEALIGAPYAEQAPRQRFVLTARLAQPQALHAALAERLPSPPSVPQAYILGLARRRRLRDGLIVLFVLLGTPLYILMIDRLLLPLR